MGIKDGQRSILPLLAVTFVGTLGFSIVTPFLVFLVTNWGGNPFVYGILAATYPFFQLFGAPVLGRMSDRVGRRRVLLFSQLGTLISWAIFLAAFALPATTLVSFGGGWFGEFALTLPLLVLFIARAADGLTGGNVSVSNAYLADITTEKTRAADFGRMAISGNLGFIIGPALAGLLGATILGELLPVLAAFAISAVALALIQFLLTDARPVPISETLQSPSACDVYGHETRPGYEVDCDKADGWRTILSLPNMTPLMSINFLVMLGFSFYYVAFPVHAVQALGWTVTEIGAYFAFLSLAMIVVQGPVLARLSKSQGDRTLMVAGAILLAGGFVALMMADRVLVYASAVLIALGNGLLWPTFMSALATAAGESRQGAVQGYAQSSGAVASIAGLLLGGAVYVWLGGLLFPLAALAFAATAGFALAFRPRPGAADAA